MTQTAKAKKAKRRHVDAIRKVKSACYRHAAAECFTVGVEYPIASIGHSSPGAAAEWHMLHTRRELAEKFARLATELEGEKKP